MTQPTHHQVVIESLTATQRAFLKVGRRPALSGMSGGERVATRAPLRTTTKKYPDEDRIATHPDAPAMHFWPGMTFSSPCSGSRLNSRRPSIRGTTHD